MRTANTKWTDWDFFFSTALLSLTYTNYDTKEIHDIEPTHWIGSLIGSRNVISFWLRPFNQRKDNEPESHLCFIVFASHESRGAHDDCQWIPFTPKRNTIDSFISGDLIMFPCFHYTYLREIDGMFFPRFQSERALLACGAPPHSINE